MDKLLDLIAKYVPAAAMTAILALVVGFFTIHYWRGFRDYSDTLRDRLFLSIAIMAVAGLGLYAVNRSPAPPQTARAPVLLVPYFEGDERDQFRTAFSAQLEQAFAKAGERHSVYSLPAFLTDYDSAVQNAQRYRARAAVYGAKVIREKDLVRLCFYITLSSSNSAKPYALVPVQFPPEVLDDIANTLLSASASTDTVAAPNPLASRLEAVESQLVAMRAALDQATVKHRETGTPAVPFEYQRKVALVIGVNEIPSTGFRLRFAEPDASAIADLFERQGFAVSRLMGSSATKANVLNAFEALRKTITSDDLAIFYYAGNSTAVLGSEKTRLLRLFLADSRMDQEGTLFTIHELRDLLVQLGPRHGLAIIDGCHGTAGLPDLNVGSGLAAAANPSSRLLQFFAASADDQFAMESVESGGGFFTQALVKVLSAGTTNQSRIWMHDVVAQTIAMVRKQSEGRQTPKLVTVSGHGEILWSGTKQDQPR